MPIAAATDKRGLKRICMSCSTRFYDFNKRPIMCPNCEVEFTGDMKIKTRRSRVANDEEPIIKDPVEEVAIESIKDVADDEVEEAETVSLEEVEEDDADEEDEALDPTLDIDEEDDLDDDDDDDDDADEEEDEEE